MTKSKRHGRIVAGVLLLVLPTAILLVAFLLFAVSNWVLSGSTTIDCAPSTSVSTSITDGVNAANGDCLETAAGTPATNVIINIILFFMGVIGVITWLPGLIIGIILLATKKE